MDRIEPYDDSGEYLHVIIETPKGSRVKFSYSQETGFFTLSKPLPEGMVFPFNFGFIPNTMAEDGDALDILVLNDEPFTQGCLLKVKPLAIIEAMQTEDGEEFRNDRLIGQAIGKETPPGFHFLTVEKETVSQIDFFFTAYNKLYGKKFKVIATHGPEEALKIVKRGIKLRRKKKKD